MLLLDLDREVPPLVHHPLHDVAGDEPDRVVRIRDQALHKRGVADVAVLLELCARGKRLGQRDAVTGREGERAVG